MKKIIIVLIMMSAIQSFSQTISGTVMYVDGTPNGSLKSTSRVKVAYDYTNDLLYTCPASGIGTNNNWAVKGEGGDVSNYLATDGTTTAEIWATGTGVTIDQNASSGELTIAIPEGVSLIDVHIKLQSSALDNSNNYYILMDYEGDRGFNSTVGDLLLPYVSLGSASAVTLSRSNPLLYSTDGYAGVDVGVSAIGGGDGSDLELAIKDFLIASTQMVHLKF